jgi:hypothetical protein
MVFCISNAIGYAKFRSRSHHAVIRVYDEAGNVIETHEHTAITAAYHNALSLGASLLLVLELHMLFKSRDQGKVLP